ncbi:MAG: GDP-perosamine synthase [Polyangiales bacterium]
MLFRRGMSAAPARIPICAPVFSGKERAYVLEAIDTGWVSSSGEFIGRFERGLAALCRVRHIAAGGNGPVALHLLLHALGIGPGDEVVLPSQTFAATGNAVVYCGGTPVFCDVDPRSWVVDLDDCIARVTPRTKAVIGVDLFGVCADYDGLRARLRAIGRDDVKVLEDAAEAIGSLVGGRPAGSLADAAIFSFFGNKTLTTGEGGAVATDDVALGARMKFLKNHGMDTKRRYYHPELGFNYRMTNLQAAVGCGQVESAAELTAAKKRIYARYRQALAGTAGVRFAEIPAGQDAVPWLNAVVDDSLDGEAARDAVIARMLEHGVETRPFFVPMHLFPYLAKGPVAGPGALPVSEYVGARGICLPSGGGLTDAEVDRSVETFLRCRRPA